MSKLQEAIKKAKDSKYKDQDSNQKLLADLSNLADQKASRSVTDIYQEVVFDEINDELMKKVQKSEGDIVVLLMRQERMKSFEKLWVTTNMDFYQTKQNKALTERIRVNHAS